MEMKTHPHARRERSFLVGLLVVSVTLGISPAAASAAPGDWAQLGYGAAHNGYQRDEMVLDRTTVRGLARAYAVRIGPAGTPVVVGDTIYVTIRAQKDLLVAMAARDGSVLWERELDSGALDFTPAVANGIVYITTLRYTSTDQGGSLYAFEASSGDLLWRVDGTASTSPVIADGKVFVGGGEEGSPSNLVAYVAASGAVLWSARAGLYAQPAAPAVSLGRVFVARVDGVYAFDETTGAQLWHRYVPGEPATTPVVASGMVLTGGWRGIRAIDVETGDARWGYPQTGIHYLNGMPAVANGTVYAHVRGQLVALGLAHGAVKWSRTISPDPNLIYESSPAVANGVVYIMGIVEARERLLAYGIGGYRKRMITAPQGGDPIISNGSVYLGGGTSGASLTTFRLPNTSA
jgi:outer membrane protein assembly factor BamB